MWAGLAYAAGLSTTFGRVKVANIAIGQTYSMEQDAGSPLIVENTSDIELELVVEVLVPKERDLIEGYEPIPSTDWIEISQNAFTVLAKGNAKTDVVITIPDDPIYSGRKYQAYIWSRTTGGSVGVGLKSKLLLTIAE